jgi:glycosyltransferase involved in cell wall biosynthesis/CDP-glycerol glycerophosphotransferase (TagB/SpsB family)/lipopolysaccharide biosynthesis regulator YciM
MKKRSMKFLATPREELSTSRVVERLPIAEEFVPASPIKKKASETYSIVTAAYNVERYLDAYFESMINQTIEFQESIEIVIVDDGSTDHTAEIIQKWIALYPKNIRYLYQENSGQGSARNHGLNYARNEWVTFTDPDDFVAPDFFEKIDESILKHASSTPIKMVSANLILYFEARDEYSDTHPLRFRFAKGDCVLPASDPGKHITLNVATIAFKRNRLLEQNIRFMSEIRPGFEDSHFVNRYLLGLGDGHVAYLASAKYFYRKRDDGSSTLDTGWQHPGRYNEQLRYGSLGIIKESIRQYGYVPDFIQRVVFYDLSWHFRKIVNNDQSLSFLEPAKKEIYKNLISEIMSYISEETILNFELAGIWFYHKVGLLSTYKKTKLLSTIVYVDGMDTIKDLVKLRYFTNDPANSECYSWDGKLSIPVFSTVRRHELLDATFIYERIVWLRIGDTHRLDVSVSDMETRISLRGKQHRKGLSTSEIYAAFKRQALDDTNFPEEVIDLRKKAKSAETIVKYGNCWLLMERDTQADDNAEHFYRYLRDKHPAIRTFFILNDTSADWARLENDGFRMIPFGSVEHQLALLNASHFISSHADEYIFGDLAKKWFGDMLNYRFTFLQHGVILHDLSHWLNSKNIDCFITTSEAEYKSIVGNGSYKFTAKEVVLAGLARHDNLRAIAKEPQRIILIMPTWRKSLVGQTINGGNERELNPDFASTQYAQSWREVLHSDQLKKLSQSNEYKIVFFPHANIKPYLSVFDVPDYIEVTNQEADKSIQEQFAQAAIMLTDYSSVAFEMAVLDRPVVYYHFDADEVMGGGHICRPGYFDYRRDGFGPVCSNLNEILSALTAIINNNGCADEVHLKNMRDTFAFKDENNCKRTFEAIDSIDRNVIDQERTHAALIEYARKSTKRGDWDQAILAWDQLQSSTEEYAGEAALSCAIAYRHVGKLEVAAEWLDRAKTTGYSAEQIRHEQLALSVERKDYLSLNSLYESDAISDLTTVLEDNVLALFAKSYRLQKNITVATELLGRAVDIEHPDILRERAEIATLLELWPEAYDLWREVIKGPLPDNISLLRSAEACRKMSNFAEALATLGKIKRSSNLPGLDLEHAEIAYASNHWKIAEREWSLVAQQGELPPECWLKLAKARRKIGTLIEAETAFNQANPLIDERTYLQERALLQSALEQWDEAVVSWESFISRKDLRPNRDAWLHLANARFNNGQVHQAKKDLEKFASQCEKTKKSEQLHDEIESALKSKTTALLQR